MVPWLRRFAVIAIACLTSSAAVPRARAFNEEVHKDLYDLAFSDPSLRERRVVPPTPAGLDAFRGYVYGLASADAAFRERWPRERAFTGAAFKELLELNPFRQVVAIDVVPAGRRRDVRTVVREGSIDPDADRRNQDRIFVDADGSVPLTAGGRAMPWDPRTLWFGPLTGPASQFDAHGATLRNGTKGRWMMTTLGRPEQYSRPPVPLGAAPEFSESYTQLAMLARLWGGPGSEWLALTFAGNSLHGIQDLGNQIHTTLIGTHRFYLDTLAAYASTRFRPLEAEEEATDPALFRPPERLTVEELRRALELRATPGAIDPPVRFALGLEPKGQPGATDLAVEILGSFHRLLEAYSEELYLEGRDRVRAGDADAALPEVVELLEVAPQGDAEFEAESASALAHAGLGTSPPGSTPFARLIGEALIVQSAPEAAPLYESIRAIAIEPLRSARTVYYGGPPLDFIQPQYHPGNPADRHNARIWQLNTAALARVVTAMRLWWGAFERETAGVAPGGPEARERAQRIASRLVAAQMEALRQAEARRAEYREEN